MTTPEIVCEMVLQRASIGRANYGVTVDRKDLTLAQWILHAQEEMLDGAQYLERVKQEHAVAIESAFREGYCAGHKHRMDDEDVEWSHSESKRRMG